MPNENAPASLRDEIAAAFDEDEKAVTTAEAKPDEQVKPDDKPAAKPVSEPGKEPDKPDPAKAAADGTKPAVKDAKEPDKKADSEGDGKLDPPARWTKEEKEEWSALDPKVQAILMKRNKGLEASYTKAMQEIATERGKFEAAGKIESAYAPFRAHFAQMGLGDDVALQSVLNTYMSAYRDPVAFIRWFAGQRQIDLAQFAPASRSANGNSQQVAPGAGEHAEVPLPPQVRLEMEALRAEVASLRTGLGQHDNLVRQTEQRQYADARASAAAELEAFAAATDKSGSPLRPFFNDVKQDMGRLMQAGLAANIEEAYDKAVYARPDLRQKLIESKEIAWRREQDQKAAEAAKKARNASSSVTASTIASPIASDAAKVAGRSLREDLEAAWSSADAA